MRVKICSRRVVERLLQTNQFPNDMVLISFYTPQTHKKAEEVFVDAAMLGERVFYVGIPDIDLECLKEYGYTYESYLEQADELAKFIYKAKAKGWGILCQCDYGQSRSPACAAAIVEHFYGRGIEICMDFRYYPNQLVYHKVHDALNTYRRLLQSERTLIDKGENNELQDTL